MSGGQLTGRRRRRRRCDGCGAPVDVVETVGVHLGEVVLMRREMVHEGDGQALPDGVDAVCPRVTQGRAG